MNGLPSLSYVDRLQEFRNADADRDKFVAEVINKYEDLESQYKMKCDDFKSEVESRRMWQNKAESRERMLAEYRQNSGSNSIVLAVIDGDGAIFQDYLFSKGREGGSDAAHRLYADIKDHLKSLYPEANVNDWNVVVQVILNLQGLATKLQSCNIISNPNELQAFARAFSVAQPLFSFIDIGHGKENADHKIRETLRVFVPNTQCKHVYFGPCNDNGYIVALERYRKDEKRFTLIETRPAEPGFRDLGFGRVRFASVFRSENLPSKNTGGMAPTTSPFIPAATPVTVRTISSAQAIPSSDIPKSISPAPPGDSTASTSWATVGKATAGGKTINVASKKAPPRRHFVVNVNDERVDEPLPRADPKAEQRFGERMSHQGKCCNDFYLRGKCDQGEYCDYLHGERLSPGELLVLKHKARSRSCPNRTACRDPDCTFGHHCKFGKGCYTPLCWFGDTHEMDLTPAKKVFEDGDVEWFQEFLNKYRN